jgi:sulfite oxidase
MWSSCLFFFFFFFFDMLFVCWLIYDLLGRNWDLHVTSSCHRIKIFSINKSRPKTAAKLQVYEKLGIPFLPITQPGPFELEDDETYDREMEARGGRDPLE